jgi:lipoyl(octanoyl) transferase
MQQANVQDPLPAAAAYAGISRGARVRALGCVDYERAWRAMQSFVAKRAETTEDELWVVEHPPVYTMGLAGHSPDLPREVNGIPLVKTDRGGKITYHGPGQVVIYLMLDLRRRALSVRPLVRLMEQSVIDLLGSYGIAAAGRVDAPGVYVRGSKVAALGLRIRNGCSYHGLAFNASMDLAPFRAIDPCGYAGLEVTQARDLGIADDATVIGVRLVRHLLERLA